MINLEKLKALIGTTVKRMFLIVFPPLGEELISQIDIRIGIEIKEKPGNLIVISTDLNDIWTPILEIEPIPINTIETTHFNKNENLKNFNHLGEIVFLNINN